MKIPDDVKIVVNYNLGGYPPESIEARVRAAGQYPSKVWYSDDEFKVISESGLVILGLGHFTRTVKTRRVVWDLPDGVLDQMFKNDIERMILTVVPLAGAPHFLTNDWKFCYGHKNWIEHTNGSRVYFKIVESTEEVPWSPFEVAK